MADSKPTAPTRRRALAALAGAAVAAPAVAIAAGNPDAEVQRLYEAIIAQEAAIKAAEDANEQAEARAIKHYPPQVVLRVTGMTPEEAGRVTVGDPLTEQQVADFDEYARLSKARSAECERLRAEHGYVEDRYDDFMDRLADLRDELAETPATTPRGVLLKLRAVLKMDSREELEQSGYAGNVIVSAIDDLEEIVGEVTS